MDEGWNFYNYAVGFVDLLGQRDKYANEALLPKFRSPSELAAFRKKVQETIGPIYDLQRATDQFMEGATKHDSSFAEQAPEQIRESYKELHKCRIVTQRWSDGLVQFTALGYPEVKVPMKAIFCMFGNLGSMCLLGLAKKCPVRGAIEVAWGIGLHPEELYGCAVAKAYHLESEVAQYPRIVIGSYMFDYLRKMVAEQPKTPADQLNQKMAEMCVDMLLEDMDGWQIIHYLGDGFKQALPYDRYA